jgi:hypothetical protein
MADYRTETVSSASSHASAGEPWALDPRVDSRQVDSRLKPQQPSADQWEEVKATVRTLYIEEDRRMKDVLHILRRDYNFLITYVRLQF